MPINAEPGFHSPAKTLLTTITIKKKMIAEACRSCGVSKNAAKGLH